MDERSLAQRVRDLAAEGTLDQRVPEDEHPELARAVNLLLEQIGRAHV